MHVRSRVGVILCKVDEISSVFIPTVHAPTYDKYDASLPWQNRTVKQQAEPTFVFG